MVLADLLLSKDEVKLFANTGFTIPIHPRLLDKGYFFDPLIAQEVFESTAREWYDELSVHTNGLLDSDEHKSWYQEVFISQRPIITRSFTGEQKLIRPYWCDTTGVRDNGFVNYFSISRNSGGSLFFDPELSSGRNHVFIGSGRLTCMSREKALRFLIPGEEVYQGRVVPVYAFEQHNVDALPGALFLRAWVLNYLNTIFARYPEVFNKD